MEARYYKYANASTQKVYFRGYVKEFRGRRVLCTSCSTVRATRGHAVRDAKKLIAKIRASI